MPNLLAKKLACHSSMDTDRKHKVSKSEIKNIITHSTAGILVHVSSLGSPNNRQQLRWKLLMQEVCITVRNSEHRELTPIKIDCRLAWWLMPVIPALWEAKVGQSFEVKSLRPVWPRW